jgi:hypothetical protein
MIVIALAALAYTWFSGIFSSLTATAGTSVTQTTGAMATQFKVESAKNTSAVAVTAVIRNVGTGTIDLTKVAAYLDGGPIVITGGNAGTLAPGGTQQIVVTVPASPVVCARTLMISIGTGLSDSKGVVC